jgi:uncharacterized Zn-finger protein
MSEVLCPKCGLRFEARDKRTYEGIMHDVNIAVQGARKAAEVWIDESAQVKCPGCNKLFTSEAVKFFGILSPKGVKILLALFAFGFFAFAMYVLFKSI